MRCFGSVNKTSVYAHGTHVRRVRCPKKARHFFDAVYRNGRRETVGFCDRCVVGKDSPSNWNGDTMRWGYSVLSFSKSEEPVRESVYDRDRAALIDRVMRIMAQKNCQKYRDEWPDIFDECVRRFTVKSVMEG